MAQSRVLFSHKMRFGRAQFNLPRDFTGYVWTVAGNLLAPAGAFAVAPLLARALDPQMRGNLGLWLLVLTLLPTVAGFGLLETSVVYMGRPARGRRALMRRLYRLALVQAMALVVVGAVFLFITASAWEGETWAVAFGLLVNGVLVASIPRRARLLISENFRALAVERLVQALSRLAIYLPLYIASKLTVTSAILGHMISVALGVTCVQLASTGQIKRRRGADPKKINPPSLKELMGNGFAIWPTSMATIVLLRIDQLAIVWLSNNSELGYYVVAVSIAELPTLLTSAVKSNLLPRLSSSGDPRAALHVCQMLLPVYIVTALLATLAAPLAISALFGDSYRRSIYMFQILIWGAPAALVYDLTGTTLIGFGGSRRLWSTLGAALGVTAAALLLLVPVWGGLGAAITSLVVYSFSALMAARQCALAGYGTQKEWLMPSLRAYMPIIQAMKSGNQR